MNSNRMIEAQIDSGGVETRLRTGRRTLTSDGALLAFVLGEADRCGG